MARRHQATLVRAGQTKGSGSKPFQRAVPEVSPLILCSEKTILTPFRWLTPTALDLAEQLLAYDPAKRATAVQALEAPYFTEEKPAAERPVGYASSISRDIPLSNLHADWHVSKASGTSLRRSENVQKRGARRKTRHDVCPWFSFPKLHSCYRYRTHCMDQSYTYLARYCSLSSF